MSGWTVVPEQDTSAWNPVHESHGAGGTWEPEESVAMRFLKNFGSQYHAALMNPMGVSAGPALPAAKLDTKGNLLPMSQQTRVDTHSPRALFQEVKDFGQSLFPINQALSGDVAGALGKATANLLMMKSAAGAEETSQGGLRLQRPAATADNTLLESYRPQLNPGQQANTLTRAINPIAQERPQLQENLLDHAGNVLKYARDNNISLDSPQNFVKAARGAGEEARNFYAKEILGPVSDEVVPVSNLYNGKLYAATPGISAQPKATLGSIDARLAQINKSLEPAYVQTDKGMVAVKLGNEADLVAESQYLRQLLYSKLSQATGIAAEDIQGLRQRYGSLKNIADTTDAAITKRETSADMTAEGRSAVPLSKVAMATHAVAKVLGLNPENIATRRIMSAIADVTIPPTPLPTVRPPLRLNLGGNQ